MTEITIPKGIKGIMMFILTRNGDTWDGSNIPMHPQTAMEFLSPSNKNEMIGWWSFNYVTDAFGEKEEVSYSR